MLHDIQGITPKEKPADLVAKSLVLSGNDHDAHELRELAALILLKSVGENPERDGLVRTPERYAKAMAGILEGYGQSASDVVGQGVFPSESQGLVSVNDIEFYSMCEHHVLPFWGRASIAYYPGEKILGLSKLPRIVDVFAKRLQVQERLTEQVAQAVGELIAPRAVLVQVRAQHLCMMMRGVEKQGSFTLTEASHGLESLTEQERARLYRAVETTEGR